MALQDDSILKSVKKILGLADEYDVFDLDVIMHINSGFTTLHSAGIGPSTVFSIEDDSTTWSEFIDGFTELNSVRTYMSMYVKLIFDPPATSFTISAMEKQLEEYLWRMHVSSENKRHATTNGI